MKKTAMLGCGIFVVGLIIAFAAFASMGFDFSKMSTNEPFEEKSFTSSGPVSSFTIDDSSCNIDLGVSPDNKVYVRYYENAKERYEIQEGTDLKFKKVTDYQWYDMILVFNFWSPSVEVLLPKNFSGDLSADSDNGRITVKELSGKEIKLQADNGDIIAQTIQSTGDLTAETSNGSVTLEDVQTTGEVEMSSQNGFIRAENLNSGGITATNSNGSIHLTDVQSTAGCRAETSNGEVVFEKLSVQKELTLGSSNGGIRGSIVGKIIDFTIDSHSGNGSNSLPDKLTGGQKMLTADTGNGDINVTFTED